MRWFILLFTLFATSSVAKTSLWQISNSDHTLYLGGTIHMLGPDDFPLPQAFDQAYLSADIVVLETDLLQLSQPHLQQLLMQQVTYRNGKTLKTQLQPRTYQLVKNFFTARGMSVTAFEHIKPAMLSLSMSVIEIKRLGLDERGVDQYFFERARNEHKLTGQLEQPEQQIQFIASMGEGNEDALLLNTLRDLENLKPVLHEIKQSWRDGDMERLERAALAPMQRDYPELYQLLLVNRNNDWLPQIINMLNTGETELILVGALHLVGEEGLLQLLKARGFSVERAVF